MVEIRRESYFILIIGFIIELILIFYFSLEGCCGNYTFNYLFFKSQLILLFITFGTVTTAFLVYYYQKKDDMLRTLRNEINYINNCIVELEKNIEFAKEYIGIRKEGKYAEVYYFPFKNSLINLLNYVYLGKNSIRKLIYSVLKHTDLVKEIGRHQLSIVDYKFFSESKNQAEHKKFKEYIRLWHSLVNMSEFMLKDSEKLTEKLELLRDKKESEIRKLQ